MTIAICNKDGSRGICFKGGKLVRETAEESYIKHNLLCYARAAKHLTTDPVLRRGSSMSLVEQLFSSAWIFYEAQTNEANLTALKTELNKSLARDYRNGKIRRVVVKNVAIVDKEKLQIECSIDTLTKIITI